MAFSDGDVGKGMRRSRVLERRGLYFFPGCEGSRLDVVVLEWLRAVGFCCRRREWRGA